MFPVSVKGVLVEAGELVLLRNERREWELPGGRLEPGEQPRDCVVREFAEELGIAVAADRLLDCALFEVVPGRHVLIVSYGVRRTAPGALRLSAEHDAIGRFAPAALDGLNLPEIYRRAIRLRIDGEGPG